MKKILIVIIPLIILSTLAFFFWLRRQPAKPNIAQPTPAPKLWELSRADRPYISLTPREDGHSLKLIITSIPASVKQIEYELIYTAIDENLEIEKGLGDTIEIDSAKIERDLLLGTESCTSGCKYKYDEGITGGIISFTLINQDKQVSSFQSNFVLKNSADLKKNPLLTLTGEAIQIKVYPTTNEFLILLKNFRSQEDPSLSAYSIFTSASGKGKVEILQPPTLKKDDLSKISGDYLF